MNLNKLSEFYMETLSYILCINAYFVFVYSIRLFESAPHVPRQIVDYNGISIFWNVLSYEYSLT